MAGAKTGRPIAKSPGQLLPPGRRVSRVDGANGVTHPDRPVEQRRGQGREQPWHPRLYYLGPSLFVDFRREVTNPLGEPAVVAEGFAPFERAHQHGIHGGAGGTGEAPRPPVQLVFEPEGGEGFAGHRSMVDEAVRQLEAGEGQAVKGGVERARGLGVQLRS